MIRSKHLEKLSSSPAQAQPAQAPSRSRLATVDGCSLSSPNHRDLLGDQQHRQPQTSHYLRCTLPFTALAGQSASQSVSVTVTVNRHRLQSPLIDCEVRNYHCGYYYYWWQFAPQPQCGQLWPSTVRVPSHQLHWLASPSPNSTLCRLSPVAVSATTDTPAGSPYPLPAPRLSPVASAPPSSPERRAHQQQGEQGQAGHSAPPVLTHPTQGHPIVDLPDPLPKTSDPTQLLARNTQLRDPPRRGPPSVLPSSHSGTRTTSIEACLLALASSKGPGGPLPLCEQQP